MTDLALKTPEPKASDWKGWLTLVFAVVCTVAGAVWGIAHEFSELDKHITRVEMAVRIIGAKQGGDTQTLVDESLKARDKASPTISTRLKNLPSFFFSTSPHSAYTSPTTPIKTSTSPTYSSISHMRASAKIQIFGWILIAAIALVRAIVLLIKWPKNVA